MPRHDTATPANAPGAGLRRDNRSILGKLVVVTALMFAFGYALVPIYRSICDVLGINVLAVATERVSTVSYDAKNTQVDASRTITVEFDANARGPWEFKPQQRSMEVHPGQMATVMYEFRNVQNRAMAAQAIPSYAPQQATAYFHKLECFCFTEQKLASGEAKEWPVVFVIDPKLPKDVKTITLSYTFFEIGGKVSGAARQSAANAAATTTPVAQGVAS